ncbi:hypothetical protein [Pseudomonas putida]|uniref:Uncharacterized protein n=1 Tax=Pseudomonas putida TaxID=303 RepID=A0AAD0LD45_PSEPU|nr:hypothetical protein [Pseudomonas putida]ANC00835.1 hypothetical protein AB688_01385 [Pseudomonas putida]AXA27370.1 hypothetical protein C1S65_25830 [Pseudomonas putida]
MNALERHPPQPRSDAWAASALHGEVRYRLDIEAEPDSLCRVLNLFALQFLTPHSVQVCQRDDLLELEIGIDGLSWHRAGVIAQKMRNLVCVGEVFLESVPKLSEVAAG